MMSIPPHHRPTPVLATHPGPLAEEVVGLGAGAEVNRQEAARTPLESESQPDGAAQSAPALLPGEVALGERSVQLAATILPVRQRSLGLVHRRGRRPLRWITVRQ